MLHKRTLAFVLGMMLSGSSQAGNVVGAYYPEWGVYARNFPVNSIPFARLTHLMYAFLPICGPNETLKAMNPNGHALLLQECQGKKDYEVTIHDTWAALGSVHNNYGKLQAAKQQHPQLKVLISIGGWSLSDPFHYLVKSRETRAVFIDSVVRFLQQYPVFDGVDIDWEYPGGGGANTALGSADEGQNYVSLIQELRAALNASGRTYLVTAAVGAGPAKIKNVPYATLFQNPAQPGLDLVFAMTYDYYGAWDGIRGHTSGLYATDVNIQSGFNADETMQNLIQAGVPRENLVLGVSMYGRAWQNVQPTSNSPLSQTPNDNSATPFALEQGMWEPGVMDYKFIQARYRHDPQYTFIFDSKAKAPFLWSASQKKLISYDNPCSTAHKLAYVKQQGLAGIFGWEIDSDNGELLAVMNGAAPSEACP